ncbi:nose resistant to fluoxetine protein 6 [Hetaerina americana]|uniref:nose resistant to fluoxetine protein 6 n=1 Tax=Hetaerina americana TaxID=62018 RepID=UPI003A7F4BD9
MGAEESMGCEANRDSRLSPHWTKYKSSLMNNSAFEVADASGRYASGFLWGNNYWTGSGSYCRMLAKSEDDVSDSGSSDPPPFPVGFYSVKIEVILTKKLTPTGRYVRIGLCLPAECSSEDVIALMRISSRTETALAMPRTVQVLEVKTPAEYYTFWTDPTFHVLVAVTSAVVLLMVIGTSYDLWLEYAKGRVAGDAESGGRPEEADAPAPILMGAYQCPPPHAASRKARPEAMEPPAREEREETAGRKTRRFPSIFCLGLPVTLNLQTSVTERGDKDCPDVMYQPKDDTSSIGGYSDIVAGLASETALSFSIRRNLATIADHTVGSDTLPTLHGLRFLSMLWVILGHTCLVAFKYSDNMAYRGVVEKEFFFQTISNAAFSVDTFFFISGLLVSFLYFRTTSKLDVKQLTRTTGAKSNILQFVGLMAYRFGRLTAPYLFVLGLVEVTMKIFYHNSVFEPPTLDHINCPKYWWRNILYINTLFPVKDMCMLWSWYLADDTQFYALGIIILILAVSHFRLAAVTTATFLISSWCTTAFIAFQNNHLPSVNDPLALFDKIYDKPWTRLGPYLVGMSVGWILFKTNCRIRMHLGAVAAGWTLSSLCLLSLLYGLYGTNLSPATAAAYSSLSHTAWALAMAWVVIACSTGYGGWVNSLLSWSPLYPFSRVTYCAYLVHPLVIRITAMNMDSPLHLGKDNITIIYLGNVVASYVLSFMVSLAFEAPAVALLKILHPKRHKADNEQNPPHYIDPTVG